MPFQKPSLQVAAVMITVVLGLSATAAAAQEVGDATPTSGANGDTQAAAGSAAPSQDEDIVVTARKRSELSRDVPIAITALSGAAIANKNIARLPDLVALVPNFTVSLGGSQPFTFVRGFGSGGNLSFEQAVGKFVDNVSYGRDFDGRLPLFDLERFELLKGPQVLLYGNSATAGAINLTTRKPASSFEADGSVGYELENREVLAQGGITVPIADWASLRIAGLYQRLARGWLYNIGNGRHEPTLRNFAVRPTLRLTPTTGLEVLLKAEYDQVRDYGALSQPIRQAVAPARSFLEVDLDDRRNSNYDVAPFFAKEANALNNETYQGDVNYDALGGTINLTTAYRNAHNFNNQGNGSQRPSLLQTVDEQYRQFSQEGRFTAKVGPLDYLLGAYYQHDITHAFVLTAANPASLGLPLPALAAFRTFDQRANSYSIFSDITYHMTSTLSIELGGRYSWIRKQTDQAANPANIVPMTSFGISRSEGTAAINPALNGLFRTLFNAVPHDLRNISTREEHFQPQVILQYKPSTATMLYARYVKGDKAGGVDFSYAGSLVTGATAEGARFKPEKAESIEFGIKGVALNRKLEYSLAAFDTTFTDLQTSIFIGTALFVSNVGKARTRGIEADLSVTPFTGLKLSMSGAYQNAKYLVYPGAPCTVLQTLATTVSPCTQDLSGAPTPFQSRFSGSISADYARPVFDGAYVLKAQASMVARSRFNTTTNNDPLGVQDGFATIDGNIELRPAGGWWSLGLFARNLTNVEFKEYSVATPLIPGGFNTFVSRGRQLGVRLGFQF